MGSGKLYLSLTLPVPYISESCIKIKINSKVYSHISLWCLKRRKKVRKKSQGSVKIKI